MQTPLSSHNCLMTDTLDRKLLALCLPFNRPWGDEGYEDECISLNHLSFQCSVQFSVSFHHPYRGSHLWPGHDLGRASILEDFP